MSLARPLTTWRLQREDWDPAERTRVETERLAAISEELADLAQRTAEQEFKTRDAFNLRLSGTATFAGVLLALALTQGKNAGDADIGGIPGVLFAVVFMAALVLLVGAIVVALWGLRPGKLTPLNPDLLRYYGRRDEPAWKLRRDAFRVHVMNIKEIRAGNGRRSLGLALAQYLLAAALCLAAVGAGLVFFAT